MPQTLPPDGLQLRSIISADGELALSLVRVPTPAPAADEVVLRVEATPINPSDIGLLFGAADLATLAVRGSGEQTVATARVPDAAMKALVGRTVAVLGGAMYSQYRTVKAELCLPLPAGASAADGASCFVNPLTALGMTETMRREGHRALVHTAAASNLGQMLQKICLKDGVDLVNIVRSAEQAKILTDIGARYVLDS